MINDAMISVAKIARAVGVCNHHLWVFWTRNAPKSYVITLEGVLMNDRKLENHSDSMVTSMQRLAASKRWAMCCTSPAVMFSTILQ